MHVMAISARCCNEAAKGGPNESCGVKSQPVSVAYYGMKQLIVKDPDGFELCFQHPAQPE